ncbi:MAG: hypothetical protein P8O07_01265, partial [Crocinitomicaceae bacterium]|nr:hypothetical protein [Crocinitomicaceae bacterium]
MKKIKQIGLIVFLFGLMFFTSLPFFGKYNVSQSHIETLLTPQEFKNIGEELVTTVSGKEFTTSKGLSQEIIAIYEAKNEELKANQLWDKVMWTLPSAFAMKIAQATNESGVTKSTWIYFLLTFGLGIIGALMYILPDLVLLGPAGIKNNGVYFNTATNRGWIGIVTFVYLVAFYIILYFYPYVMVNQISLLDPIKGWFIEG